MRRVFGPWTVVEAAFIVAVPVVALFLGARWPAIVGAAAVGYLLVLVVEIALARLRAKPRTRAVPAAAPAAAAPPPPPPVAPPPPPPVAPAQPEPEPQPEPQPEAVSEPVLQAVPDPEPEPEPEPPPEPEPQPEPQPAAAPVVPIGVGAAPRAWNLWDLERLCRDAAGSDAARDEERSFLLLYLREFADPDGELPVDFDRLVRESFGDLVGAR